MNCLSPYCNKMSNDIQRSDHSIHMDNITQAVSDSIEDREERRILLKEKAENLRNKKEKKMNDNTGYVRFYIGAKEIEDYVKSKLEGSFKDKNIKLVKASFDLFGDDSDAVNMGFIVADNMVETEDACGMEKYELDIKEILEIQ